MKPWRLGLVIAAVSGILISAQQSASVVEEVLRQERAQADATLKKDRVAYERLLSDDYSYVHSDGGVTATKADVNKFSPGVLRFMRMWVNDGGSWKLAAEQRTPIAAAARPKT